MKYRIVMDMEQQVFSPNKILFQYRVCGSKRIRESKRKANEFIKKWQSGNHTDWVTGFSSGMWLCGPMKVSYNKDNSTVEIILYGNPFINLKLAESWRCVK